MKELSEIRESQARCEVKTEMLEQKVDKLDGSINVITDKLGEVATSVAVLADRSSFVKKLVTVVLTALLGAGAVGGGVKALSTADAQEVPVVERMAGPIKPPNAWPGLRDE